MGKSGFVERGLLVVIELVFRFVSVPLSRFVLEGVSGGWDSCEEDGGESEGSNVLVVGVMDSPTTIGDDPKGEEREECEFEVTDIEIGVVPFLK
jgi:hypothetical protein